MFCIDFDNTRHPVSIEVLGAGADWANGQYIATRVWRGSVQVLNTLTDADVC